MQALKMSFENGVETMRRYLEHVEEGLRQFLHAKLRTFLALLGVLVGSASVVAMVLGGQLATNQALLEFKSLGTDLLAVSLMNSGDAPSANSPSADITMDQALGLETANPAIQAIAPYTQLYYPLNYQGTQMNGMILGVTNHFQNVVHVVMEKGRFITLADRYAFFCVLGHGLYEQIKAVSMKDPLGQPIQIGDNSFVVVGVAAPWPENSFVYANIDDSVMIPLMASVAISQYATINNIILRLSPTADITAVEASIQNRVNAILPNKALNFRSAKELIAKMKRQNDILTVFLGLIGSVSLVVGGIGVMNIMLVSVIERRREIGIRLAVGATRRDITLLFLTESVMLSVLGGSLGVLLGLLIAYLIATFNHWAFTVFWLAPLAGFSVSVLVGIFFGWYPALLAARQDPIEALRSGH